MAVSRIQFEPPKMWDGGQWVEDENSEFIQLNNTSPGNVFLFDPSASTNTWRLRGGVDFQFPADVMVSQGAGLLVAGFNPTNAALLNAFRIKYPFSSNLPVFGPSAGRLANKGDSIS